MAKYIDADKFKAAIEKRISLLNKEFEREDIVGTAKITLDATRASLLELKSILDSLQEPKIERWKPSKEQMETLENAIYYGAECFQDVLESLYDDLSKL